MRKKKKKDPEKSSLSRNHVVINFIQHVLHNFIIKPKDRMLIFIKSSMRSANNGQSQKNSMWAGDQNLNYGLGVQKPKNISANLGSWTNKHNIFDILTYLIHIWMKHRRGEV